MKKYLLLFVLALPLVFMACNDDDDDNNNNPAPATIDLTQANLNAATNVIVPLKTGIHIQPNPTTPSVMDTIPGAAHAQLPLTADSTIRKVYASYNAESRKPKAAGDITVKHVYKKNALGATGELLAVLVAHRQNAGYFSGGGDLEYAVIPATSVNAENPNGKIADAAERGKVQMCGDCHNRALGGTYLFTRAF